MIRVTFITHSPNGPYVGCGAPGCGTLDADLEAVPRIGETVLGPHLDGIVTGVTWSIVDRPGRDVSRHLYANVLVKAAD